MCLPKSPKYLIQKWLQTKHTQNRLPQTNNFGAQNGDWASKAPKIDLIIRTIITRSSQKITARISPEIPGGQNPRFQETCCYAVKIQWLACDWHFVVVWLACYSRSVGSPTQPTCGKFSTADMWEVKQSHIFLQRKSTSTIRGMSDARGCCLILASYVPMHRKTSKVMCTRPRRHTLV